MTFYLLIYSVVVKSLLLTNIDEEKINCKQKIAI